MSKTLADLPELWTPSERTRANLAAMHLAAELARAPRELSDDDRHVLARYSGWGGLSIQAAASKFPPGFPVPEERGLVHEYYTPSRVCAEVARVVRPLVDELAGIDGSVQALEPSAGIGRFLRAFEGPGFESLEWHAVEYSKLSGAMLRALRPDVDLYIGSFEQWVADNEHHYSGEVNLVVANPPYGRRGESITDDPNREYRLKDSYAYFLRRALDLLAADGLGVFLIPSGFLTGTSAKHVELRTAVLRRHHLSAAYRLPSGLFPGAMLVTDLLFFRARGGELPEVDEGDRFILEGRYFKQFPKHILGREVGAPGDDDDQTAKSRFGYQVEGEFTALPDLVERSMCGTCAAVPFARPKATRMPKLVRDTEGLVPRLAAASSLGQRVHAFLAAVAAQESEEPSLAWEELHQALLDWTKTSDVPPSLDVELVKLAKSGDLGAQRFLSAFEPRSMKLIPALRVKPTWSPRYQGRPGDVVARAEFLYRQHRSLSRKDLGAVDLAPLFHAGWCEDEPGELVPGDIYYTGHLWPKYDRAKARADRGDAQAAAQARKILELIAPAMFDEIDVSLRHGWVPLELIEEWMGEALNYGKRVKLEREGLVQAKNGNYDELDDREGGQGLSPDAVWLLGYINHDKTLFTPKKRKSDDIDKVRLAKADEWEKAFRAWCGADEGRREKIERAYHRQFQGYRAPGFSSEPLALARWTKTGKKLHPYQAAGARRVLANRGGLIAYDVGLGKTYTGCAVIAAARQEGWCKRPLVIVPNSLVWKWRRDFADVLPDYRVGVIGSKRKVIQHGPRKGHPTSETDTPAERAATWTRFMGGEFDVVLCTYSALPRTKLNKDAVLAYARHTAAIQREIKLRQRNARNAGGRMTERQHAVLLQGAGAWVAEQMELPEGWQYDPGVTWDEIGVDLVVVDEAQNFKNLYLPEDREGGVPRFMGNPGEGSKRAWQLDFRLAAVRARTGGAGVVLLSATPAKNSPLEFYNLLQYVDHDVFTRMGIHDPEAFIDRYCRLEIRQVVDAKMEVVERSACVGFKNLHELRDVIFRLGEFKTAQDVGLPLPKPTVHTIEVALDALQEQKYAEYVREIEDLLEKPKPGQSQGAMLGLLARLGLVAIHANLDEGFTWKNADRVKNAHSPKFDALAKEILKSPACGHIVFCDNVAAHAWIRRVLVEAGIPDERIAVLNAEVAKAAADRQRIAQEFNGNPDEGLEPKYDVVIANNVAYEGVDLQTRTCAIHHLDLPWEPATLEQRNGRGVRQGNKLAVVAINYYFALRSSDGMRYDLIQGKNAWMVELLKSQKRDTNNPGAQTQLGPEEILLLISRDPAKTKKKLDAVRAKREAEAKQKIADEASGVLRQAAVRFARARELADEQDAKRLRLEAEQRLADLALVSRDAWPWAAWAVHARDHAMLVPPNGGSPVYDGLRVGIPDAVDKASIQYTEFGQTREGTTIGVRRAGSPAWRAATIPEVVQLKIQPEHLATTWPDDDAQIAEAMRTRALPHARAWPDRTWNELGWMHATESFLERQWPRFGEALVKEMASGWAADRVRVPVVAGDKLHVGLNKTFDRVIPPTRAGWQEFLQRAPTSGLTFAALEAAGQFWWGLKIPRNLLSAGRDAPASKAPTSAAAAVSSRRPSSVSATAAVSSRRPSSVGAVSAASPVSAPAPSGRVAPSKRPTTSASAGEEDEAAPPASSVRPTASARPASARSSKRHHAFPAPLEAEQTSIEGAVVEPPSLASARVNLGPPSSTHRREVVTVRQVDGEPIDVEVLHREGDILVHRAIAGDKEQFAVTHEGAGARVRGFSTLEDARIFAWDLNNPEVRPALDALLKAKFDVKRPKDAKVKAASDHLLAILDARAPMRAELYLRAHGEAASVEDDDLGFALVDDDDLGFALVDDDDLGFALVNS